MKKTLAILAVILFGGLAHADGVPVELLRCLQKQQRPGAPMYTVTMEQSDVTGQPDAYYFNKVVTNPSVRPVQFQISKPFIRGDAFIVTVDAGRSGYMHLYSHGKTAVIDISLFAQRDSGVNTEHPITDYVCSKPE